MAARQLDAAFPDERLVPLRQSHNELVRIGPPCRVLDLGVSRVVPPVRDVVTHRAVEQEHLLLHEGQQVSIAAQLQVANVRSVEQQAAARRIVKPGNEVGHGGLPRSAPAHERDHRSSRDRDVEVLNDRLAFAVLERHVLETDLANHVGRLAGAGAIGLVVLHRQHFEDPLHRGERALQLGERVHDVPDGIEQQEHVPLKRHDVAH